MRNSAGAGSGKAQEAQETQEQPVARRRPRHAQAPGRVETQDSLTADLRALGIAAGQTLLVHASMRQIGWVHGGETTVVAALRDVLGTEGNLVVPTETAANSDTSRLYRARVAGMSADEIRRYRAAMPPFDPATSPSNGSGRIAERVRTTPGAVRSLHPQSSFAALGPLADKITSGHSPDCHLGEASPVARLYEVGAWILLLGVGYEACSALHLAEYRYVDNPPRRTYRCVVTRHGRAQWWEYEDVVLDDRDLGKIGAELDETGLVTRGTVGAADCRLLPLAPSVDVATRWLAQYRAR